jgi:hypothetical protein
MVAISLKASLLTTTSLTRVEGMSVSFKNAAARQDCCHKNAMKHMGVIFETIT